MGFDMVKRPTSVETKKRYDYEEELENLHLELMKLQEWVKAKGLKVLVLFEGRDRKSTRLNSSHSQQSRMPSSA